jgi:predicted methyltransferase
VLNASTLEAALAKDGRSEADVKRDERSKPADVLGLVGLKTGDVVADIFGGSGYYSEIIANTVGESGKVYLHNNKAYLGFVQSGLNARIAAGLPSQVVDHRAEVDDMAFPASSLDLAMIVMSYHDIYHIDEKSGWFAIDGKDFLGQVHKALKPGGRFLIVDHQAKQGSGNKDAQVLHRIEESFAIADLESKGFKLVSKSDALRNPLDNYALSVFDPAVRFKTDRFILLFEKL